MDTKIIILHLAVAFALTNYVTSLRILGIFPYPGKSHFHVQRVFLQELARRGHSVTVVSHFPETEDLSNYNDISLAGSTAKVISSTGFDDFPFLKLYLTLLYRARPIMSSGRESCEVLLANKEVQKLIAGKPKFDLVVVEQFNTDCALGVAYKLQAPVVGLTSHILLPWHYSRFGIPQNPSFVPFPFTHGGSKPTILQKIEAIIFNAYFNAMFHYYEQRGDQNTLAQYFDDIPPLEDLAKEIKFLLLYQNFVLTGPRLLPPNVIEVGGYHITETKPLPEDLLKFINEAEHGVIYVNFGSVIKSSTMSRESKEAIIRAMQSMPQRFIWKWESEDVPLSKDKLFVLDWFPQVDILAHPKTLAFFSHCGMAGTTEAIHFGVPVVAMPKYGDQPANAAAVEESGMGVRVQIENLTKDKILAAFDRVLDPKFRENVKRLSKAWHDRPLKPLQTAVYWTEFAARHHNITLRTPAADLSTYQYYNVDILGVFTLFIIFIILTVKSLTRIYQSLKRVKFNSMQKENKKVKKQYSNIVIFFKSNLIYPALRLEVGSRLHEVAVDDVSSRHVISMYFYECVSTL